MSNNDGLVFLVLLSLLGLGCSSSLDFDNVVQDLSTEELQNIIREIDYMEDDLRSDPRDFYEDEEDEWSLPKINIRSDDENDFNNKVEGVNQKVSSAHGSGQSGRSGNNNNKAVLPAYCDPPNPCPIGYTSNDGCIDDFENSSEYSRKFQSTQNCLCDSEHMFNCPEENIPEDKSFLTSLPNIIDDVSIRNPFFAGQRLPIAAKKGFAF